MGNAKIFVWKEEFDPALSNHDVQKGYVCSLAKAKRIAELLEEGALWVESFAVVGFDLGFHGIQTIDEGKLRKRLAS